MWNPDDIYESICYQLRWSCLVPADDTTLDAMKYVLEQLQEMNDRNREFLEGSITKRECVEMLLKDMEEKE